VKTIQQTGASLIGILFFLIFIAFIGLLGFKLTPIYLSNYTVKSVLKSVKNDPRITKIQTKGEMQVAAKKMIIKNLQINNIYNINYNEIHTKKTLKGIEISIKYEERTRFLANIDLALTFDDSIKVDQQ